MRTLITSAAAGLVLAAGITPAAAVDQNTTRQLCVDFTSSGTFYPHQAEDYATWEAIRGKRVAGFDNAVRCSDLAPTAGAVWNGVNPFPTPAQTPAPVDQAPASSTCEPVVQVVEKVVQVPVERVQVVQVESAAAAATIERQASKIERQAKRIAKLRQKLEAAR